MKDIASCILSDVGKKLIPSSQPKPVAVEVAEEKPSQSKYDEIKNLIAKVKK